MKKLLLINFIILDGCKISNAQTSINITYANDSNSVYWCGMQPPPITTEFTIEASTLGYNQLDSFLFKIDFGDGTYQTFFDLLPSASGFISSLGYQTYLAYGTHNVTYTLLGPDGNADTLFIPDEVIISDSCAGIIVRIFADNNFNCIYDLGDNLLAIPSTIKNGSASYGYYYPGFTAPTGVNYTVSIDQSYAQTFGLSKCLPCIGLYKFYP